MTPIRVALDGSFLWMPTTGTGTYVRSLIAELQATCPEVELSVLSPRWHQDYPTPDESGAYVRYTVADPSWSERLERAVAKRHRLRRFVWDVAGITMAVHKAKANPDLLHVAHFSAPFRPKLPFVVTIHDVIPLVLPAYRASREMRLYLALMRRAVKRAQLVLVPSHATASEIERVLGIPQACIRVTPEAAGPEYTPAPDKVEPAAVARKLGIGSRYIFNVGGLDIRKNLPVLLEAFARALTHLREPAQLVIAGAAHSANPVVFRPLTPIIERLGLGGKVVLTGRVSETEKLALYQGADLYVTPSLHEGFGLTALEAMACGVPTIAANRTSLPEVVGDGGLLVEPAPEPLAAAMVGVLNNPTRSAALRDRGIARAATFSWERTARLTTAAYEEAIALSRQAVASGQSTYLRGKA